MDVLRVVDAYCASCEEVRTHAVTTDDPSACYCNNCGASQTLVAPLVEPQPSRRPWRSRQHRAPPAAWSREDLLQGLRTMAEALDGSADLDALQSGMRTVRTTLDRVLSAPPPAWTSAQRVAAAST